MGITSEFPANYTNVQFRPSKIESAIFGSDLTVSQIRRATLIQTLKYHFDAKCTFKHCYPNAYYMVCYRFCIGINQGAESKVLWDSTPLTLKRRFNEIPGCYWMFWSGKWGTRAEDVRQAKVKNDAHLGRFLGNIVPNELPYIRTVWQ